jgi:hypothetical protein
MDAFGLTGLISNDLAFFASAGEYDVSAPVTVDTGTKNYCLAAGAKL